MFESLYQIKDKEEFIEELNDELNDIIQNYKKAFVKNYGIYNNLRLKCRELYVNIKNRPTGLIFQELMEALNVARQNSSKTLGQEIQTIYDDLNKLYKKFPQFFDKGKKEKTVNVKTIKTVADKIHDQIDKMTNGDISKHEFVICAIGALNLTNSTYCGYFIDLDLVKNRVKCPSKNNSLEYLNQIERELFSIIDTMIENSPQDRIQVIIASGSHYFTIDIDKKHKSCLILDAANDSKRRSIYQMPKHSKYITKAVYDASSSFFDFKAKKFRRNAPQRDDFSCPIFSLDQGYEAANVRKLHSQLENIAKTSNSKNRVALRSDEVAPTIIDWMKLPPTLIKNAQTDTWLQRYMKANEQHKKILLSLTQNNKKGYALEQARKQFINMVQLQLQRLNCDEKTLETVLDASVINHLPIKLPTKKQTNSFTF